MGWGIGEVLQGWGQALNTPFGWFFLVIAGIYIILRITGKMPNIIPGIGSNTKGNKGGSNSPSKQRPDYIIK